MEEYPAGSRLGVSTRLKILVIPGSVRAKSYNVRLAALAAKELTLADAEVTRISLGDYPLPLYDADLAHESGPPENALRLKRLMSAHQGVFITSPEYNASITPILKNAIDWISAAREHGARAPLTCRDCEAGDRHRRAADLLAERRLDGGSQARA